MSAVCQVGYNCVETCLHVAVLRGHAGASADIDGDTPVALLSCYGRNWVQQARVSRVPYNKENEILCLVNLRNGLGASMCSCNGASGLGEQGAEVPGVTFALQRSKFNT